MTAIVNTSLAVMVRRERETHAGARLHGLGLELGRKVAQVELNVCEQAGLCAAEPTCEGTYDSLGRRL